MAKQILYLHWKAVWMGLVPIMIASFGLPLLIVQGLGRPDGLTDGFYAVMVLDHITSSSLGMFPGLAAITGVALALTTWNWDHQGKHIYALSLPIPRWRYTVLKFGAGLILTVPPAVAMLAGASLASASLDLPPFIHAYPFAVTTRFFLSTIVIFALLFAFAAGSVRTTVILLSALIIILVAGGPALHLVGGLVGQPDLAKLDFTSWLADVLTGLGGPFHIITGNWALIDV